MVSGAGDLGRDVRHVPWREELTLLHVDRLAGLAGCEQQIGLAAEEGWDLQHIDRPRGDGALIGCMHIGERRETGGFAHLGKDRQAVANPGAARGGTEVRLALSKLDL